MLLRATEGASLDRCVAIAAAACQHAEQEHPRSGPGRKPDVPDWVVAAMVVVGVMHRKKTRAAQYAFWESRVALFVREFPDQRLLSRSQFYDRARRSAALLRAAIKRLGAHAVRRGWADARSVALDKSLIAARGRKRPSPRRKASRGVDSDAAWGYSGHDGWIYGYSYEVVVSAGKGATVWPLLASVDAANRSEQKSCLEKLADLPPSARYVLADAGYDSNAVGEAVEDSAAGRRFVCPEIPRPQVGKPRAGNRCEDRARQHHRRRRESRRRFTQSSQGRRLYRRRKVTVEPFNSRFKQTFELHERAWHWGLANNSVMILAAIAAYQVLLTYNHQRRRRHARIQHLLNPL